ncbi:Lon protease 2 [Candidatus Methanoperedenaceae archaeon GB37]|nr:Lon protease 2 [Candidatus Methanoperedenaceae archaeon GB37]
MPEEKTLFPTGEVKIPQELPILPSQDLVLFPKMVLPLVVAEPKLIQLIDDALSGDKIIGLVVTKKGEEAKTPPENLYQVGCAAQILKMAKVPDVGVRLLVQGLARIGIMNYLQTEPYLKATVVPHYDEIEKDVEIDALVTNIRGLFRKVVELSPYLPSELGVMAMNVDEAGVLADMVTSTLNISKEDKQKILETFDIKERLREVVKFLNREIEVLELANKIQTQVKSDLDKAQREYFLRQQLKAIQKELGEKDEHEIEIEELKARIKEKGLPEAAAKEAEKELNRLARMNPASPEYVVARTYLDWVLELPWNESTQDNLDINSARGILDKDHYDLDKVKKRILEYLAVRKLKPDAKGSILCFVGPPGTGKTSLGRSIATALGRKFVRISLGGIRDEAEIRGHRRTYVGALPGKIIQGMKKAGSNNPVFMLDEIDKIGADFRGDPAAALLEVLDPEQNYAFVDHYLGVEFDLSKVMFITTANILDTIPPPLRDRMEILELPGYTVQEKVKIAEKYLIPRQLDAHGLSENYIKFENEAIKKIILDYTREAGLRNLEREIASICRQVAVKIAEGKEELTVITAENLADFLGPPRFYREVAERVTEPGVATGLAWTPTGGEIIFVEATKMAGKKSLVLTGHLGEIMKESAETALSYIRSKAQQFGISEDFYEHNDIHIHIPAGAIPKDGPSAGVAICTALVSLFKNKPVRSDLAMTGEITLRGLVLPVGGIKEKVLAAHLAGIKYVALPKKNENDLTEVPKEVKEDIKFLFIEKIEEVINFALKEDVPSDKS